MADILTLYSNNSMLPLTPDGLRALTKAEGRGADLKDVAEYRVHKLSERLGVLPIDVVYALDG